MPRLGIVIAVTGVAIVLAIGVGIVAFTANACRFVPCDALHLITVENDQPQVFQVFAGARSQPNAFHIGDVNGCSVKTFEFVAARPPDQPIIVMARDAQGTKVTSPEQTPQWLGDHYALSLLIPRRSPSDCPTINRSPTP